MSSNGMTNARMPEVDVKNAVIELSDWVCLIADSSKWNSNSFAPIAPLERGHNIISDSGLSRDAQLQITQLGIGLELV
jgi:DeoR/GlpR family transcriptional regulator of sugar metabolism